ncbi:MAG TPA: SbcC/MukB-like Walker B domain-containing protein, partial [Gemmatimonadaceae bacterium]
KLRAAQALARDRRKLLMAELNGIRLTMQDPAVVERALAESRSRLEEAERRRAAAEARMREAEAAFAQLAPTWAEAQRARDLQQQLASDLRVAQNDDAARVRELERVERELAEIAGATAELEQLAVQLVPLAAVQEEFARLEALAREEGRRQTLAETERLLTEELARLGERRAQIARAPDEERELGVALDRARRELDDVGGRLEARRTDWVRDRQEAETKRDALRRQYQELKAQRDRLLDLGEEGVCPTCTRVLGPSFRTVLDQLDEQMATIEVDGKYYRTRLEQLSQTPDEIRELEERRKALMADVATLERQRAQAQATVRELEQNARDMATREQRRDAVRRELAAIPTGYDAARHAALADELARLAPLNDRAARLNAQREREPALRAERERLEAERVASADRVRALAARLEQTGFSEDAYHRVQRDYEAAAAEARAAEVALTSAQADATVAREARDHAERARIELDRARERFNALERDKRLHDELDRAYTDLRADLNFELRPELAEIASAFLSELTDARYAEISLDDQYNVVVLEDGIPKPVISGGEEDLSNLVLRLAISQMIAERAGQTFSLLVLDEIFGSLDEMRRRNVVELLRRLQDRFEQVVLITHIESVREDLDRVILVDYDEHTGASRVRQVEPSAPAVDEMLERLAAGSADGAGRGGAP